MIQKIRRKKLRINIIPLIDIIFLMLVFFMLATNFTEIKKIRFSINSSVDKTISSKNTLIVNLKSNKYFVLDNEILKNNIEKRIQSLWKNENYKNVVVLNDKNSEVESLIYLLDILKTNKIEAVTFANEID